METSVILWKAMMTALAWGGFALAFRHRDWLMEKNRQLYDPGWSESFTRKYVRVSFTVGVIFLVFWTAFLWFVV